MIYVNNILNSFANSKIFRSTVLSAAMAGTATAIGGLVTDQFDRNIGEEGQQIMQECILREYGIEAQFAHPPKILISTIMGALVGFLYAGVIDPHLVRLFRLNPDLTAIRAATVATCLVAKNWGSIMLWDHNDNNWVSTGLPRRLVIEIINNATANRNDTTYFPEEETVETLLR